MAAPPTRIPPLQLTGAPFRLLFSTTEAVDSHISHDRSQGKDARPYPDRFPATVGCVIHLMNDNTSWIPLHDSLPDTATTSESASDYLLSQWFQSLEHEPPSPQRGHDRQSTMDLQHIDGTLDECWRPFHGVRQQEPPKAPRRDEMLSPLPLQGMQQLFPFQDTVIPPTPPLPEPSLPPAPSTYHAYSSLTAAQAMSPTSPSIPYFSTPTYFNVPYGQSTAYLVSPPSQCLPSYEGSPGGASVSSHRSLGQISSPGQASVYYSLPPSPATRASSVYYTPMQAAPSTLPDISGASQTLPSSGTSSTPTRLRRVRIKQTIPYSSEWRDTAKETFTTGGIPGVPVLAVLQDCTALDRHEEITALKITKVRLIRLVIAWPGYGEDRHYITVKKGEVCMTRGELAQAICSQISTFMTRAAKQHPRPKYAQWAIGKHGITIDQLWLVSLAKAQTGVWLAGLEVLL